MSLSEYGPFANIVAIASALIATFSLLLLKMLGRVKRWSFLTVDSPPFLVTAGARMLALTLMAITYITISAVNYLWFGVAAVVFGILGFVTVGYFDYLRKLSVLDIPLVGPDGAQLLDARGKPVSKKVVIGSESELLPRAKADFEAARINHGGLSLPKFMSGYGSPPNDPEALWDRGLLVKKSNRLTMTLMGVILLGVMTLFLAAFVIEVTTRK